MYTKKVINTASTIICLLSIIGSKALANDNINADANIQLASTDQELLDELLTIVDESTTIATKNKMNANSVPGTVTVLQGKDMEALGFNTAYQALALVPGILPTKDNLGGTSVLARGLSFPFSSGNVKIMVNSLSMSRESSGFNSSILQIPIEQIERIEVIRGPGAVLYGDNAFMGMVNIITYDDKQRLFTRVEGNGAVSGGVMGSYQNEPNQLQVQGNFYGYGNDSADAPNGEFADDDRQFGVFSVDFHGFSLQAQSYHQDYQLIGSDIVREGNDMIALRQKIAITPTLNTELNFSFLQNDFNRPGQNYNGDKIEGAIDFNWTGMENHQWWFKFTYTDESIDDALQRRPSPPGLPQRPDLRLSNISRKHYSLSLQDQFELFDNLTLTASLRFDHRDDLGTDFFSPRFAAVWRINDEHTLKAQYAEGFRVPTFFELYNQTGRIELKQESIATSELSYIFHQAHHTGKLTLFFSQVSDMIFPEGNSFSNTSKAENMGIEFEWKQQLSKNLKWQANLSFIDSWDTRARDRSKNEDQASTNWLSNVAIFYQPIDKVLLTAHWNYTGQRNKTEFDLPAENNLSLTLNTFDVFTKGLGIKFGIQNLLKDNSKDIRTGPQGSTVIDYGDKQMLWAQVSYSL